MKRGRWRQPKQGVSDLRIGDDQRILGVSQHSTYDINPKGLQTKWAKIHASQLLFKVLFLF